MKRIANLLLIAVLLGAASIGRAQDGPYVVEYYWTLAKISASHPRF
ncbi:MAG: hypothetical protein ACKVX9_04355 [Blastocatellia bacterium]